jgi:peptidyl-prolyl cis-trans isomerase D
MRENLKSMAWILWVVVAILFGLVFFQWGGYSRRQTRDTDAAATVGGESISYGEFQREYQNLEARFRDAFGERYNSDIAKQFNLPKRALDQLIDRRIMLREARNVGLTVTDGEVREAILELGVFKDESGRFIGTEAYNRLLRANRMTADEFESAKRDDVLLDKLNGVLAETSFISDSEVEQAYRDETERVKIRYVELPATQVGEVEVEAAEVESYFAEHRSDYELPERRVVDYLLVDTVKLRQEVEIPEEELRAYYDDHPDEFTREEQVRARHILFKVTPERGDEQAREDLAAVRRRIEGGEDFAQLARELSEDEGSASRGGSLGFFGRGQMIPAFEEAAFSAPPGTLVGPLKTDFGYHLIEVQDHRPGGLQAFEQARAAVRSRLIGERVDEIASAKAEDVAQRLRTPSGETPAGEEGEAAEADPMARLAGEEGLELKTTEPFGRDDTVAGIGRSPAFLSAAFELAESAVSEPVKIPRGWVILRLAESIPPRVPELAEVEAEVRRAVEQEKRGSAAVERLREARSSLEAGGDFAALAADLGLEITDSEELGRFDNLPGLSASRQIVDAALALEEGQWGGPVATDGGAVLFEVVERQSFDAAAFEEAKETTRQGLETARLNRLMTSLIELRRRDLAPSYDPRVFTNFGIELPGGDAPAS